MGFYWLPDGVHKKMDSVRAKFLWQGTEEKFRYHMAKLEMVARPKDQGGMGVINTRIMNDCLLVKWIWKIFTNPKEPWFEIIKAKYLDAGGFFDSKTKGSSQFWKGLHRVKHLFKWGAIFQVGNGEVCRFWTDCWLLNVPLSVAFSNLFVLTSDPNCTVSDCFNQGEWGVDFKRTLTPDEYELWNMLKAILEEHSLNPGSEDSVKWALEKNGIYSTKSLYRFITDGGMVSRIAGYIWKCKIPLKIKFFLWQTFNNKLQVAQSLSKRGWKGDIHCCLCGAFETVNHLLFGCSLARFVWGVVQTIFHLDWLPNSLDDLSCVWFQGRGPVPKRLLMFFFAGFAWSIWTTRNKMAIEKTFPKAPTDVVYTAVSLVQKWTLMLKEKDRERVEDILNNITIWLRGFRPREILLSDVVEL